MDRLVVIRNALKIVQIERKTLRNLPKRLSENPIWCETERNCLRGLNKVELTNWFEKIAYLPCLGPSGGWQVPLCCRRTW
jgi:hypothetical protein